MSVVRVISTYNYCKKCIKVFSIKNFFRKSDLFSTLRMSTFATLSPTAHVFTHYIFSPFSCPSKLKIACGSPPPNRKNGVQPIISQGMDEIRNLMKQTKF